jgi:type IV pilus assembly protein PilC
MSLADSWSQYPQYFEHFLTDMLRQNENENQNQNQAIILAKIAEYRETMEESEMDLIQGMGYPFAYLAIVSIVVLIVSTILLLYVIPVFADLFYSFGTKLPAPTLDFINFSDWLIANHWLILGTALGLGALLWIKWQSVFSTEVLAVGNAKTSVEKMPLFGRFYHQIALVRSLRTCAFMISHQTLSEKSEKSEKLEKAFDAAAQAVNNSVYAKLLKQVSQEISTGTSLSDALAMKKAFFPKKVLHATAVGIQSNQLDKLLTRVADVYTKQLYQMIGLIVKTYNFVGLILLASIVGAVLVAMYLPILSMGSVM